MNKHEYSMRLLERLMKACRTWVDEGDHAPWFGRYTRCVPVFYSTKPRVDPISQQTRSRLANGGVMVAGKRKGEDADRHTIARTISLTAQMGPIDCVVEISVILSITTSLSTHILPT